ncbi:hypothetical protein KKA39_01920 [Patescibacteria group bacterium]|nr:hypothetical protein [Patescibacteria group bacterium]
MKESLGHLFESGDIGPGETVGSFARKMQIKKERELHEKYKPTEEEESVIKFLSMPILKKIRELQDELRDMPNGMEKSKIENGINMLFTKLVKVKIPQQMSDQDIKDLLFTANVNRNFLEEEKSTMSNMQKLNSLDKEIDFLLDQLSKRNK